MAYIAAAVVLIPLVTYALSRLKPAAPSVDRATVWTDTVKRGPMLREVRGLVADCIVKTSVVQAEELAKQNEIAEKQVETFANSIEAQIAVQQANVNGKRALYDLKRSQLDQLHVRPGIDGVLQDLSVEVGQQV